MVIEIVSFVLLVLINGLLALSEVALIAVDVHDLRNLSHSNNRAKIALKLAQNPNNFLSTVQIGITMAGIFAGVLGGATIAENLNINLLGNSILASYSEEISFLLFTLFSTSIFIIFGELIPKRIAMHNPLKVTLYIVPLMSTLSFVLYPFVRVLSKIVNVTLKIFKVSGDPRYEIEDQDIINLLTEGTRRGVFHISEKSVIENTLVVGDKAVSEFMRPISQTFWLNYQDTDEKTVKKVLTAFHGELPVFNGDLELENLLGIVKTEDLLRAILQDEKEFKLKDLLYHPVVLKQDTSALAAIKAFKNVEVRVAIIIDDDKEIIGLISDADVADAIIGI